MRHTSSFFNMRLFRNKLALLLIKNCCERLSLEEINCNRISTTCLAVSRFDPKLFVEPITRLEELDELPPDDMRNFLHPKPMKSDATPVFYRDRVVDKLIRIFMLYGRKELSRKLVYDALELVKRYQFKKWLDAKTDDERSAIILDPFVIANKAIFNCRPLMKLKPLQRGGVTYQVPHPVGEEESEFRAMKMMKLVCREKTKKGSTHFEQILANEFIAASNNEGFTIQAKQELHKQCEANRAYAHYRVARRL